MARSRRRRVRTVGAVIVNPPRRRSRKAGSAKRRTAAKKAARTRKANKAKRSRAAKKGALKRRRNPGRKRRIVRRRKTTARRRNPSRRRRSTKRSRAAKKGWRSRARRKNPGRKRRIVRRRKTYRRRNPSGMFSGLQSSLRKIPFIGAPLAIVLGTVPFAVPAALAVELPLQATTMIAQYDLGPLNFMKGSVAAYYATMGAVGAALAHWLVPGTAETKTKAAIAVASSFWGVAYYKMRESMMANAAGASTIEEQIAPAVPIEGLGALVMSSRGSYGALAVGGQSMGMAPAYTVGPQGYGSPMGAVVIGG